MAGGAYIAAAFSCALTGATEIQLDEPSLRIEDVVLLNCLEAHERQRVGQFEIARLTGHLHTDALSREAIANLIRRRVPMLGDMALSGAPRDTILLRAPAADAPAQGARSCYVAIRSISADEPISEAAVEPATCPDGAFQSPITYDRVAALTRARRFIAEGEPIGAMPAPPSIVADAGEELAIIVRVGPIAIERRVEAISASDGGSVFVRDDEGVVFSVPMEVRQ